MKKKYWWIGGWVLVTLVAVGGFLSWGKEKAPEAEAEKIPFIIQTATIEDLSSVSKVEKFGTLMGAQAISVSSQVFGRVKSLPVRAGEEVDANDLIVELQDTSSSATFQAQRAEVQLDISRNSYSLTLTQLEQWVVDAKNALEQAKAQYESTRQNGGSTATIQSQQADQQIAKADLDYQNLLASNDQTIKNFLSSAQNIAREVELLYQDITVDADKILWVSDLYKQTNNYFEQSLGAQNSATRRDAQTKLRELMIKEDQFTNMSAEYTETNIVSKLQELQQRLRDFTPVLDSIETMFQFTTASSNLSQAQIDLYKSQFDAYQAQVQAKLSAVTEQINSMQSFLSTYKELEQAALKQKQVIEQWARLTESSLGDSEELARLSVERAQAAYDSAVKNRQQNVAWLQNSIDQAQISLSEAYDTLDKFEVLTPIEGTVGEVLVDVWQEVSAGTPLVTINSANAQQVEISLTQEELGFVTMWQEVTVISDDQEIPGIVISIANTADQNFTYITIIELTETVELFGDIVTVEIDVRTKHPLVPLNVVTILNNNEWLINTRNGELIKPLRVQLGKVWDDLIEIRTGLDEDLKVIVSDVKNYNSTRHTLQEQDME